MDKETVSVEKKEEMNEPEYEHPVQVRIVWGCNSEDIECGRGLKQIRI